MRGSVTLTTPHLLGDPRPRLAPEADPVPGALDLPDGNFVALGFSLDGVVDVAADELAADLFGDFRGGGAATLGSTVAYAVRVRSPRQGVGVGDALAAALGD